MGIAEGAAEPAVVAGESRPRPPAHLLVFRLQLVEHPALAQRLVLVDEPLRPGPLVGPIDPGAPGVTTSGTHACTPAGSAVKSGGRIPTTVRLSRPLPARRMARPTMRASGLRELWRSNPISC